MIIETHCHLDYLKQDTLEGIIKRSQEAGVEKIITISVEPDNLDPVYQLAQDHEIIYATQGIHPHDAKLADDESLKKIFDRVGKNKIVAVGEIGLDFHYNNSPRDIQIEVFKKQLQIAIDKNMPVVIHSRDADEDMIKILSEYAPKMNRKGVIHSFTSGPELAKKALELGFHLGFNGIITFKKAQEVRDIVELCPVERILLETDSPFLTPVPHRGKENAPFYLPHIAQMVADIKNISVDEIIKATTQNAINLFKF